MSESTELPNVDIFDPVMCARRWAQCATQQEINVYLNKQIDINRTVLKDTIDAQNSINAASKTKLDNHEKRIAALESELKTLDEAQSELNTSFKNLQTDNNNFKSEVDLLLNKYQSTINLLQQNIDKITTSNEELWNEVNNLKSQFDPDKLNAAIAGYDSVLKETKAYTDSEAAKLKKGLDGLAQEIDNVNKDWKQTVNNNNVEWNKSLDSYRNSINSDLEQQNQRITSFIQNTDNVLQLQRTWLTGEISRVDERIDSLSHTVVKNKNDIEGKLSDEKSRVNSELANQREEYTSLDKAQSESIESERVKSEERDENLSAGLNSLGLSLSELQTSDGKQWTTINEILQAQNLINKHMEELYKYVNEEIRLVKSDIESIKDDSKQQKETISNIVSDLGTVIEHDITGVEIIRFLNDGVVEPEITYETDGLTIVYDKTSTAAYNNVHLTVTPKNGYTGVWVSSGVLQSSLPLNNVTVNPSNTNSNKVIADYWSDDSKGYGRVVALYNAVTKVVKVIIYKATSDGDYYY